LRWPYPCISGFAAETGTGKERRLVCPYLPPAAPPGNEHSAANQTRSPLAAQGCVLVFEVPDSVVSEDKSLTPRFSEDNTSIDAALRQPKKHPPKPSVSGGCLTERSRGAGLSAGPGWFFYRQHLRPQQRPHALPAPNNTHSQANIIHTSFGYVRSLLWDNASYDLKCLPVLRPCEMPQNKVSRRIPAACPMLFLWVYYRQIREMKCYPWQGWEWPGRIGRIRARAAASRPFRKSGARPDAALRNKKGRRLRLQAPSLPQHEFSDWTKPRAARPFLCESVWQPLATRGRAASGKTRGVRAGPPLPGQTAKAPHSPKKSGQPLIITISEKKVLHFSVSYDNMTQAPSNRHCDTDKV